jgi:hypothetical protein
MKRFKDYLFVAVGVGTLSLAITFTNVGHVVAQTTRPQQVSVPVRDVDNPARLNLEQDFSCIAPAGQDECAVPEFIVPTDKILVIETVSARAILPAGQQPVVNLSISQPAAARAHQYSLPLTLVASNGGTNIFGSTQLVRVYARPGGNFAFAIRRFGDTSEVAEFLFAVSGYLVDVR